jgi:hypothetical protein
MNREFKSTSPLLRSVFAAAAVFAVVLTAGFIDGLAEHYSAGSQMASTQPVLVAQR